MSPDARPRTRIAVFADFDDTLTTRNVAHYLLRRFAPEALEKYSSKYRSGEITFREYQEKSFNAVTVPLKDLQAAAESEIEIRAGIRELLAAIDHAGGSVTIASAGLHLYVDPVLKRHGLENLDVICGSAERTGSDEGGFSYDYPSSGTKDGPCRGDWATCKCNALEQAGDQAVTVFVGDGSTSDACVAEKADYVFARDRLLRICNENGIAAIPFADFTPVTEFVTKLSTETENLAVRRPERR